MIRMTSRSVRRKSPMSAWRRSTSSTKRLTERLWLNLSAMAAAAVTAVEVAAAATLAVEAAITAAAAMVVAAVVAAAASAFGGAAAVAAAADIGAGGMAIGTGAVGITSPSFLLPRQAA